MKKFQEAIVLEQPNAEVLSALEEAYDIPQAFHAFCQGFREEHPEVNESSFVHWYLEPTEPHDFLQKQLSEAFAESLSPDWVWHDQFDDCSFTVGNGLEIHAANGRDLWHINLSAPRILRQTSGDFAVETVVTSPPASLLVGKGAGGLGPNPAIGGILLWKDKQNYLRLDKGTRGKYEINFAGCINNEDKVIGRGRLVSEKAYLRLERVGNHVNALCSADGEEWFTAGSVEFPVDDPVEVGLHAIGMIDRTIYHGAFLEGTAVRFEEFELWGNA